MEADTYHIQHAIHFTQLEKEMLPLFMLLFKTKFLFLCSLIFAYTLFSVVELQIPVEEKNFSSIYLVLS